MKNNKGMILSTYVYMLLVFFLLLLGTMLVVLNNTKLLADKMKENAKDNPAINKDLISLVLNGDDEIVVIKGDTFTDPGYIARTQSGKSLTAKVEGTVDTNTVGEYTITYILNYKQFSKTVTRKVFVTDAIYEFDYTGSEQVFTAPVSGYYKLETWGAQGGSATYSTTSHKGGYGGYSTGQIYLNKGQTIYINVGGMGQSVSGITSYTNDTGYNGGSYGTAYDGNSNHGGGGGATHIATSTGLLKDLSSNKDSVIIVASGGGGASTHAQLTNYSGNGGSGGGVTGVAGITATSTCYAYGLGGTQDSGGSYTLCTGGYNPNMSRVGTPGFGYGSGFSSFSTGNGYEYAGGGGGYYGGGPGYHAPAGGGSGYIGNVSLTQKSMYCYKCSTSISTDAYTVSTENVSETATANYAKEGNGYAKIMLVKSSANDETEFQSPRVYDYIKSSQTFTVPKTGTYKIELWGASGGGTNAGKGGYTKGEITLTKGEKIYIYVGGAGGDNATVTNVGGYNGGGYSGNNSGQKSYGGGGATDIRITSGVWNDVTSLRSRIMVAAGGAGATTGSTTIAGGAGGLIGGDGTSSNSTYNTSKYLPTGSTQTAVGSAVGSAYKGAFGYAPQTNTSGWAGGGGSGYYAGGNGDGTTGAGGSSYISGHTGCVAVTSASDTTAKSGCTTGTTDNACSIHYSSKKFTNTTMIDGTGYSWTNSKQGQVSMPNPTGGNYSAGVGHTGNGYAKITYISG